MGTELINYPAQNNWVRSLTASSQHTAASILVSRRILSSRHFTACGHCKHSSLRARSNWSSRSAISIIVPRSWGTVRRHRGFSSLHEHGILKYPDLYLIGHYIYLKCSSVLICHRSVQDQLGGRCCVMPFLTHRQTITYLWARQRSLPLWMMGR